MPVLAMSSHSPVSVLDELLRVRATPARRPDDEDRLPGFSQERARQPSGPAPLSGEPAL